jgi:FKBP-type peptidyl-prolyl cis-trans isomerase SlyD
MITKNTVVGLSYILTSSSGEQLDRADKSDPFYYLHGADNIIPGLEEQLEGLKVGDKKKVSVAPEMGYGEVNPNLKIKVGRNAFPEGSDIAVGMQFAADVGSGQPMSFTVEQVIGDDIFLDGNHPLAGQVLHFDVEVLSVRKATAEEIEHGHAHGPDASHTH